MVFEGKKEAVNAYKSGRCDALTTDYSQLAAFRTTFADPAAHVILPDVISKEPLAPLVKHGDNQWKDLVTWTVIGLITAEELGVTKANVDDMKAKSDNPTIQRMLGVSGDYGSYIGLGKGLAVPGDQGDRQLRRNFRAQSRLRQRVEDGARQERAVVEGRPPLRPAASLAMSIRGARTASRGPRASPADRFGMTKQAPQSAGDIAPPRRRPTGPPTA